MLHKATHHKLTLKVDEALRGHILQNTVLLIYAPPQHAHPGVAGRKRKGDGTAVDLEAVLLESVIEKAQRSQVTIKKII